MQRIVDARKTACDVYDAAEQTAVRVRAWLESVPAADRADALDEYESDHDAADSSASSGDPYENRAFEDEDAAVLFD